MTICYPRFIAHFSCLLLALAGSFGQAHAQVVFEGTLPRTLSLAPEASVLIDLPVRNQGIEAAVAELRVTASIIPPGDYLLESASTCPLALLSVFDSPATFLLQPGELPLQLVGGTAPPAVAVPAVGDWSLAALGLLLLAALIMRARLR